MYTERYCRMWDLLFAADYALTHDAENAAKVASNGIKAWLEERAENGIFERTERPFKVGA